MGWLTEVAGSFCAIGVYAKFYVNPPLSSPRTLKKKQGTVRPSLHQPPGPVTIRRRSAAQRCADARTDTAALGDSRRSIESDIGFDQIMRPREVSQG